METKFKMKKKYKLLFLIGMITISLIGGIQIGMILQQQIFTLSLVEIAQGLEGTTFNIEVDINETLMVDRTTENMKEILWGFRMQNCTRTQKGYCAVECYENNKLIPCEYFSADEHFCNEGICENSGICPDYFERLENKTIEDCIKEMEMIK